MDFNGNKIPSDVLSEAQLKKMRGRAPVEKRKKIARLSEFLDGLSLAEGGKAREEYDPDRVNDRLRSYGKSSRATYSSVGPAPGAARRTASAASSIRPDQFNEMLPHSAARPNGQAGRVPGGLTFTKAGPPTGPSRVARGFREQTIGSAHGGEHLAYALRGQAKKNYGPSIGREESGPMGTLRMAKRSGHTAG